MQDHVLSASASVVMLDHYTAYKARGWQHSCGARLHWDAQAVVRHATVAACNWYKLTALIEVCVSVVSGIKGTCRRK